MKSIIEEIKRQNMSIIIFEIFVVLICVIGVTWAATYVTKKMNANISTANLSIAFTGSSTLPSANLIPIEDSTAVTASGNSVSCNTTNALCVNFTVKGASTNPNIDDIIYDVSLDNLTIDNALKSKYVKWHLYKNNNLISSGSMDEAVITNNKMFLTDIQQDLPKYNATADSYLFVLWISEVCSDLTNCEEYIDQSDLYGKNISGKIEIDLYRGKKKAR